MEGNHYCGLYSSTPSSKYINIYAHIEGFCCYCCCLVLRRETIFHKVFAIYSPIWQFMIECTSIWLLSYHGPETACRYYYIILLSSTMITSIVFILLWPPAEWEKTTSNFLHHNPHLVLDVSIPCILHWVSLWPPLLAPPLLTPKCWKS